MAEVVVGILVQLGEPDDLLGVDALAVDNGGYLPVRAAGVKADAAAVHIAAHRLGDLVGGGAGLQRQIKDFQLLLVELLHKAIVEFPLTAGLVSRLQFLRQLGAAADGDLKAADGPQQELHIPLHIPVVGFRHVGGAVDEGVVHGDPAPVTLHGDGDGLLRVLQVGLPPDAEGDKGGVQLGGMLHLVFNA